MSNSGKNVIIVLGVVTVFFAAYYFFSHEASLVLRSTESERQLEQMLVQTQEFVQHRQVLDKVTLDAAFLQSQEFRSLRTFSPETQQYPIGRTNPFLPSGARQVISPVTE